MKRFVILIASVLSLNIVCQSQGVSAVVAGKTYSIALGSNPQKSLFVKNSVPDNMAPIVLWAEAGVPAQQWTAEVDAQGRFAFKNVYTGKYLNYASGLLSQYSGRSWWVLEPLGEDGETCYVKKGNSYLRVDNTDDGTAPQMGAAQAWILREVEAQPELTESVRKRMADGFLRQYMQDKGTGYRTFVNGGWSESETQEALLDMYEATGDHRYLSIYEACYSYFKYHVGQTWTGGTQVGGYGWYGYSFNDDVMWQIIGAARAYLLTGNSLYINDAKRNFDLIWQRAYLGYVGLLRWAEQDGDRNSANSCVNGPAEVAACYIALGTGDESYFEKAKLLYENQRTYLANMSTGQVYDSAIFDPATGEVKSRNTWASTYNQGTMLGAAVLLYQHYGDAQYRSDADKIISYSRTNMCDASGIIRVCQNANGDFQGFKGILMRYAGLYVRAFGASASTYDKWLKANAMRAYCNMNSRTFGHSAWLTKAAEDLKFGDVDYSKEAFGASTALSAAFATAVPDGSPSGVITAEQTTAEANHSLFTIHNSQAGHYRLNVYYKSNSRQTVYMTVNDGDAATRAYTVTGQHTGVRPYFVTLHEGSNTLALAADSNGELPTIEKVEALWLAPVAGSLEAEHAQTRGQAAIAADGDASGGQYVGFIGGGTANTVTFYYDAETAGDYDLDITYFTAEARQMYIRLNNGTKDVRQFDSTGSYNANTARTKTFRIRLKTGTNTIMLGNDTGWAPNVDKIELRRVQDSSAISETVNSKSVNSKCYDLRGVQMTGHSSQCGVYVKNGKKIVR